MGQRLGPGQGMTSSRLSPALYTPGGRQATLLGANRLAVNGAGAESASGSSRRKVAPEKATARFVDNLGQPGPRT